MASRLADGFDGHVLRYYCYKGTTAIEFYRPIVYLFFLSLSRISSQSRRTARIRQSGG